MCKPKYVPVLLSMHRERTTPDSLGAGRWRAARLGMRVKWSKENCKL